MPVKAAVFAAGALISLEEGSRFLQNPSNGAAGVFAVVGAIIAFGAFRIR